MMKDNHEETVLFRVDGEEVANKSRQVLVAVYQALKEKGYNPLNQMVGYMLSGDPAYITSHKNARSLIRQVERDELLEEIVGTYLELAEKNNL